MGLGRHKLFICRLSLSAKVENRVISVYIRNRTAELQKQPFINFVQSGTGLKRPL